MEESREKGVTLAELKEEMRELKHIMEKLVKQNNELTKLIRTHIFNYHTTDRNIKEEEDSEEDSEEDFDEVEERKALNTFAHTERGMRRYLVESQDTYCIMESFYNNMTFFAVYDGHGPNGRCASEFANLSVRKYILKNKKVLYELEDKEVKEFFEKMCVHVQSKFQNKKTDYKLSGTCAIMALIKNNMVHVANLGNSRTIVCMCSKDEVKPIQVSS
eukprot:TRINITY_DN1204_c0_g6_i1.p1 TRINITY_DN1204_c0_g6~~TRINITY_DN1204_c0_g6_i1.p1  ORF type:complete len:217 (+),score=52.18 TRINITY_DN1204_c0_g6_i1:62-712(+)